MYSSDIIFKVYWTMMDPVPLDKEIVDKFHGKTMAVIGYETDQVMWRSRIADSRIL